MIEFARVVDVHPEAHSVDIVIMRSNQRFTGCRVLTHSAGGDFGSSGLAVPTNTGFDAKNSKQRDIYAAVAFSGTHPVVLGFFHPEVSQGLFEDKNRMIHRFPSDVYVNADADGNIEVFHPSGAYVRIGEGHAHEDLTGKDFDKIWKIKNNTGKQTSIILENAPGGEHKASVLLTPDGDAMIDATGDVRVKAGGDAQVEAGGDIRVKSGGKLQAQAGGEADLQASGDVRVKSDGSIQLHGGSDVRIKADGGSITLQSVTGKLVV